MLALRRTATRALQRAKCSATRSEQRKAFSTSDAAATAAPVATAPSSAAAVTPAPAPRIYTPLYQLPVPAVLPEFTWDEVHARNSPDPSGSGYWIVIDSHIYDVSRYARFHPGGDIAAIFSRGHGRDRGSQFAEVHGIKEKNVTQRFCVGRIKAGSVNTRQAELDEKERREEAEAEARDAAAAAAAAAAPTFSSGDSNSGR